jgi:hypothetical protein
VSIDETYETIQPPAKNLPSNLPLNMGQVAQREAGSNFRFSKFGFRIQSELYTDKNAQNKPSRHSILSRPTLPRTGPSPEWHLPRSQPNTRDSGGGPYNQWSPNKRKKSGGPATLQGVPRTHETRQWRISFESGNKAMQETVHHTLARFISDESPGPSLPSLRYAG